MQYTVGWWNQTQPIPVSLKEGNNTFLFMRSSTRELVFKEFFLYKTEPVSLLDARVDSWGSVVVLCLRPMYPHHSSHTAATTATLNSRCQSHQETTPPRHLLRFLPQAPTLRYVCQLCRSIMCLSVCRLDWVATVLTFSGSSVYICSISRAFPGLATHFCEGGAHRGNLFFLLFRFLLIPTALSRVSLPSLKSTVVVPVMRLASNTRDPELARTSLAVLYLQMVSMRATATTIPMPLRAARHPAPSLGLL